MIKQIILILSLLPFCLQLQAQEYRKIFIHSEYQLLNYQYLQIGIGYAPSKHLVTINRDNENFSFIGYRVAFQDNLNNSDWGVSIQSIALGGKIGNPGFRNRIEF